MEVNEINIYTIQNLNIMPCVRFEVFHNDENLNSGIVGYDTKILVTTFETAWHRNLGDCNP
jgi:hypothetical protein